MLSPIRPLQSTEVRRVDEVTPRKYVAPRVPYPFAETSDGVRLTIGDDARRLAYGRGGASGQRTTSSEPQFSPAAATPPVEVDASEEPDTNVLQGASLPLAFQSEAASEQSASPPDANGLANRALRAFTSGGVTARELSATESSFPEEDAARPWSPEDSAKVPFEVFQRAVTDATSGTKVTNANRAVSFAPLQPIFYAPENGGEPFGRAVPFEPEDASTPVPVDSVTTNSSDAGAKLSKEEVDQLISDLSWSLPEHAVRSSRTAAA